MRIPLSCGPKAPFCPHSLFPGVQTQQPGASLAPSKPSPWCRAGGEQLEPIKGC